MKYSMPTYSLKRMKKNRTEEMAQSGKRLPGKHEDLKLNPRIYVHLDMSTTTRLVLYGQIHFY